MNTRRPDIDWLRIGAVLLLFDFHTAMVFTPLAFHLKSEQTSRLLYAFVLFIKPWFFPLFFFLCGAAAFYSLSHRSYAEYIKERCLRLLVPLFFGIPLLAAPQVYLGALEEGTFKGGLFEWFPTFFAERFDWCHLWFLAYLFVFSMIGLSFFRAVTKNRRLNFASLETTPFRRGALIFSTALIPAAICAGLRPVFPAEARHFIYDWADVLLFFFFFAAGYVMHLGHGLQEAIDRYWRYAGGAALAATAMFFALQGMGPSPEPGYTAGLGRLQFLSGILAWLWVMTFWGLARTHLQFEDGLRSYANPAVLPLYLLHQTVITAVAFLLAEIQAHALLQFLIIDLIAFVLTLAAYEVLIKRVLPLRVIFGMRSI